MKLLLQREGRVVPRATLLRKIWGSVNSENSSILNVYIHALRRKIERDPLRPRHILTVRGRGLYFEA
jgi:DNA-binding response OmpR family regulator